MGQVSFLRRARHGATLLIALASIGSSSLAAGPRYEAKWSDGKRTLGEEVYDWTDHGEQARLDNQKLFGASRPIRWLRDQTLVTSDPSSACLYFVGGDRLPGKVVDYIASDDATLESEPHLRVEAATAVELPGAERVRPLRILPASLERIVWTTGKTRPDRPGTAYLRDEREYEFRSLRWRPNGVQLLLEDRVVTVDFPELAELQMPECERWSWHCRRLAKLTPSLRSTLMQLHAVDGLCVTSSLERCSMRTLTGRNDSAHWVQFIQPEWSLDPLFVRHTTIALRTFFQPHEMPLTWLTPVASRHRAIFSGSWHTPRLNHNVRGGNLRNGGQFFAWGLGVNAFHELEYELPAGVAILQTSMGLDEIAGRGGSARGKIVAGDRESQPLYESPVMIGSMSQADSGRLTLPTQQQSHFRLRLIADDAMLETPPGADPFDIRDTFDWLEPTLTCEQKWLQRQLDQSLESAIPGWTTEDRYGLDWLANNVVDIHERPIPACRTALVPRDTLTLTRTALIRPGHETLRIVLGQPAFDEQHAQLTVLVNQRPLATVPVPGRRAPQGYRPIEIDLAAYVNREVVIDLQLRALHRDARVVWCGSTWQSQREAEK